MELQNDVSSANSAQFVPARKQQIELVQIH